MRHEDCPCIKIGLRQRPGNSLGPMERNATFLPLTGNGAGLGYGADGGKIGMSDMLKAQGHHQ